MTLKRRKFSHEFKVEVIREIEAGKSMAQAAREYELHPTLIGRWRKAHLRYAKSAFTGNGHVDKDQARISELERVVGQLTMENELLTLRRT